MSERLPFWTGSRVYGTPRPASDHDLVVRMSGCIADQLRSIVGAWKLDFLQLNIIACETNEQYDAWMKARELCCLEMPCSRDRAIEIHKSSGATGYENPGPGANP